MFLLKGINILIESTDKFYSNIHINNSVQNCLINENTWRKAHDFSLNVVNRTNKTAWFYLVAQCTVQQKY